MDKKTGKDPLGASSPCEESTPRGLDAAGPANISLKDLGPCGMKVAPPNLTAHEELRAETFALIRYFNSHPRELSALACPRPNQAYGTGYPIPSPLLEPFKERRENLRRIFAHLVDSDQVRPFPLCFLTQLYLAILQTAFHDQFRENNSMDIPLCVDRILTCFLDGTGWRY